MVPEIVDRRAHLVQGDGAGDCPSQFAVCREQFRFRTETINQARVTVEAEEEEQGDEFIRSAALIIAEPERETVRWQRRGRSLAPDQGPRIEQRSGGNIHFQVGGAPVARPAGARGLAVDTRDSGWRFASCSRRYFQNTTCDL